MNCPNCGASNQEGAAWCNNCYKPLGGAAAPPAAGEQQPGAAPPGGQYVPPPSGGYPQAPASDFKYDLADKKSVYDADGRMIGAAAGKPVAPKKSRTGLWIGLGVLAVVVVVVVIVVLS